MYFLLSNSNSTFVLSKEAIQDGEPGARTANREPPNSVCPNYNSINRPKIAAYMKHYLLGLLALLLMFRLAGQSSCFSMYISTEPAPPGEIVCLDVTAEGVDNLMGFQYTMRWDTAALRYSHLDNFNLPGLGASSFGTQPSAVDNGYLSASWFEPTLSGVDVSGGQVVYSICFEARAALAGLHAVYFDSAPTRIEFIDSNTELLPSYALVNGGAYAGGSSAPAITSACALPPDCQAGTGGSVDIVVSGGQPVYTFDWREDGSTVSTGQNLSAAGAGHYRLQVTDAQGLVAGGTFVLRESGIEAEYSYNCAGNNASLSCTVTSGGLAPFTFTWNTGQEETAQQSSAITVPGTGDYSVTITDAAGCTLAMDTYHLDCGQGSGFLTSYSYECRFFGGDSALADVSLVVWSGGTPPYTFAWSNGEVDVDPLVSVNEGLANGAYSVTITDANGEVHEPAPAVVDCVSAPQGFSVGSNYECTFFPSEDSVSIDVSVIVWSGAQPPYTFSWSTGEVQTDTLQSTIAVSTAGAYSVTITDALGNTHVEPVYVDGCGPAPSRLEIQETSALSGELVCVEVSATQMQDLDSLLMAIRWNPGFMELESVQPALLTSGFNPADAGLGIFQLDWSSGGSPLDISGPAPLFLLCFRVLAPAGQGIPLSFHTSLQAPEAYDSNGQPIGFEWRNGAVLVAPDSPGEAVQLAVESTSADPGSPVCLDITTANFTGVVSVQFTVRWDTASLRFDSLLFGALPGLTASNNFNLAETPNGLLRFSWFSASLEPLALPDGASLFTLCYTTSSLPGISTVSISSVPTIIEVADGVSVLPVTVTGGSVITLDPQAWPGDTDTDGAVNHYDLLNIGLAYGAAGPPRPNASIDWVQQPALDWPQTTPLSLVNYKHIDTDGNGLAEAADTLAIVQNWGLQAPGEGRPAGEMVANRQLNSVLYIRPDTVTLGAPAVFDVMLGDDSSPAEDVYGLAFTIVYDTAAVEPGSAFMSFGASWLGQPPQGLLALSRDRYADGRIDVALTRIDGQNASGQGAIAQLHITIQDVIFMMRGTQYEMILDVENVRLINSAEEWAEIITQPSMIAIGEVLNATEEADGPEGLKVFPVPASGRLFIQSAEHPVQRVQVLGMDGRPLITRENVTELSVAGLPSGPYLLRVWTEKGLVVKRIVVIR